MRDTSDRYLVTRLLWSSNHKGPLCGVMDTDRRPVRSLAPPIGLEPITLRLSVSASPESEASRLIGQSVRSGLAWCTSPIPRVRATRNTRASSQ